MYRFWWTSLSALWALWVLAFVVRRARGPRERAATDRVSAWGIALQSAAYFVVWSAGAYSPEDLASWRLAAFFPLAIGALALIWTAIPALGKQWRLKAGVNVDHELIQTGPYRYLRHPIYASMLALLLATSALIARPRPFMLGLALFVAGTEIRVRAEERLLAGRFGDRYAEYRRRVRAYVPFVR
jgi:protein-S-isoprenylcysteine O-methyltransferase Ste14